MKVAMVTPYWSPVRGGVTTFVADLSEELRRDFGFEVTVVAREGGAPGATVVGGAPRAFVSRAVAELERERPDVVHAHGHWYALQSALRYRGHHPGTRAVFTLHTEFPSGSAVRAFALRRLLSRADVITALSRDLMEKTLRMIPFATRTEVVPPGVGMARAPAHRVGTFLRAVGLQQRGPLVGFLGPLAYDRKAEGVALLIEAMDRVRSVVPGSTLVVAGDGPHRARLEALAARTAPGTVVFLGSVQDASSFLSALDVYAHISLQEGFGLAIIEAMACGVPVVATRVGGIPEVVRSGENGILVSGDSREIAEALMTVLRSRDLSQRLVETAHRDVSERFTWRRAAEKFSRLYKG